MYCSKCGKQIDDNAYFCSYCGAPVSRPSAGSAPQRPVYQQAPQPQAPRPQAPKPQAAKSTKSPIWARIVVAVAVYFVARYLVAPLIVGTPKSKAAPTEPTYSFTTPQIVPAVTEVTVPPAPTAPTAPETIECHWEQAHINGANVSALTMNKPVKNCTEMTVNIEIAMHANTSCKNWELWIRKNGTFQKECNIYLPDGNGSTSETVHFSPACTFDAVTVCPTAAGGYSWDMNIWLTDIMCD